MKKHNFIFSCVRRFVAVVAVMSMLFTLTSLSSTWSWYTGTITVRGAEIQLAKLKAATMVNSARRTYTQPVSFADDEPEVVPVPAGTDMAYCLGEYREISTLPETWCVGVSRMNVNAVKHQAKLLEWKERVAACRSSGLSVKRWCQENVSVKSLGV